VREPGEGEAFSLKILLVKQVIQGRKRREKEVGGCYPAATAWHHWALGLLIQEVKGPSLCGKEK